ncbi:nucleotidyltransferase domain-containing protein [Actinacidiphila rubida]|nr:nucleotidyltransferase domain-containing protein [Actinacidiphila rubida]
MARQLAAVEGVVGVCLGGSRARGAHQPGSDVDLGLYYRAPLDTATLRRLATELTGAAVEVTEPGGWGPWVDGGAWLAVGGRAVDWIYRDVDRVRRLWEECERGRFEIGTQPGHPLGVYSHAYPGELALGRILADPEGELRALQERMSAYPEPLRDALIANAHWEPAFILGGARKGAARGDAFYVSGCLFRAVGVLVQAMHAHDRRWLVNEKGAVASAARLPSAPPDFASRAHALFASAGASPEALGAVLDTADALVAEVCALLPPAG